MTPNATPRSFEQPPKNEVARPSNIGSSNDLENSTEIYCSTECSVEQYLSKVIYIRNFHDDDDAHVVDVEVDDDVDVDVVDHVDAKDDVDDDAHVDDR